MPTLGDQELYNATYEAALKVLASPACQRGEYAKKFQMNTPMYHYASGHRDTAVDEKAVRSTYAGPAADTANRWTGSPGVAVPGREGKVGVYMALEEAGGLDTIFSELMHYIVDGKKTGATEYYTYLKNENPALVRAEVSAIHYQFLYSTNWGLTSLNISRPPAHDAMTRAMVDADPTPKTFVGCVYRELLKIPLYSKLSLYNLYNHPTDASFCRALGNAALSDARYPAITVSSTRGKGTTVVIASAFSATGVPCDALRATGRSTFFIHEREPGGQVTINDMLYNDKLFAGTERVPSIRGIGEGNDNPGGTPTATL